MDAANGGSAAGAENNGNDNDNDNNGTNDVEGDDNLAYAAPVDYDKMIKLFKLREGTRLPMKDFLPEVRNNRKYFNSIHTL